MLNGIYPIFIIQKVENNIAVGLPFIIYLSSILGIVDVNENKSFQLANDTLNNYMKNTLSLSSTTLASGAIKGGAKLEQTVKQRPLGNILNINFEGDENNAILRLFLVFLDKIFENINGYFLSYFNKSIIIYKAKLSDFAYTRNSGTNKVNINISLLIEKTDNSKKDEKSDGIIPLQQGSGVVFQ
ncbi:MAG: hypothetical protein LBF97_06355 [Elusimicrobiota bacterium]|jgi:hypothetical protein|nr:hypothetical protein [Elusimicrobiota bacterium]